MHPSYGMNRNGVKQRLFVVRMLILVFALTLVCGAAKADTIGTYTVNGTLASGGTVTGSFTFDYSPTSGGINPITAVDITADGINFTECPGGTGGKCNLYTGLDGGTADGFGVSDPTGYTYINILWNAVDFSNLPNMLTLIDSSFCVDCGTNGTLSAWGMYYDQLVSGTAVDPPPTATPEGGSLSMLLIGLLGLGAFMAWRARQGKVAGELA
jgi:hypothetical protein